jgi:peptidoglycan/xylan/chitin deacetylase (PgdA/CDA1 family)
VAVTFDDAYADVPLHALPALERHSVPATVFAVTAHARDGRGFWWDPPAAAARSATVAELQRLAAHPLIEVGSHTRKHPALTRVNGAALRTELTGSRDDLAEWLGRPPAGFAHPFGAVSRHTLRAVRAAGYAYAAGIHAAAVTRASDRFDAPRLTAYDEDAGALERRLAAALRNG